MAKFFVLAFAVVLITGCTNGQKQSTPSGRDIFRYADIYPHGIIYLDSAISIDRQYLIFKNDSVLELKNGVFGGCKGITIHLNSQKRVKEILFYYSDDFDAAKYISDLAGLYNKPGLSNRIIQDAEYKIYSWVDNRTILEFEERIEGKNNMRYSCILKSRNK